MKEHVVKIPMAITTRVARQVLLVKKNSPAIMFGAGVGGAITATVLACKATLRLDDIVTESEKEMLRVREAPALHPGKYSEKDRDRDLTFLRIKMSKDIAKLYAPAVGVGLISVGLLTGSHVVLTKRNASLAAAYALLDKGFNEYRERVRAEYGEDKEKELRYGAVAKEIVEEGEHGHEVKTVTRIGAHGYSIYARPFEKGNPNWSNHHMDNRTFITTQQNWANDRLHHKGHLLLNDVYDMLGMTRSKAGCIVGWVKNNPRGGDNYITFGLDENNREVHSFMVGDEKAIWLDFNVDGPVYNLLDD